MKRSVSIESRDRLHGLITDPDMSLVGIIDIAGSGCERRKCFKPGELQFVDAVMDITARKNNRRGTANSGIGTCFSICPSLSGS